MSTSIVAKDQLATFRDMLDKSKTSLAAVLPKHITPERMVKAAMVAISKNPVLLQCDRTSVLQSVMAASQLGLDCSGVLGSAYLVPYRNPKKGSFDCQLIPGYRGLIDLARRSGEISTIEAHIIHENDTYEVEFGLNPVLKHTPCLSVDMGDKVGRPIIAYAVAVLRDGTKQCEVMTWAEIMRIKSRSKARDNGPWVTDEEEMARKTVVRRLCKYLPLSVELQDAIQLEDRAEQGIVLPDIPEGAVEAVLEAAPGDGGQPEPPPPSKAAATAEKLKQRKGAFVAQPPAEEPPPVAAGNHCASCGHTKAAHYDSDGKPRACAVCLCPEYAAPAEGQSN